MDNSLKALEEQLQGFAPRGLSDHGYRQCVHLLDSLASNSSRGGKVVPLSGGSRAQRRAQPQSMLTWPRAAVAAVAVLAVGISSGWQLGRSVKTTPEPVVETIDPIGLSGAISVDVASLQEVTARDLANRKEKRNGSQEDLSARGEQSEAPEPGP